MAEQTAAEEDAAAELAKTVGDDEVVVLFACGHAVKNPPAPRSVCTGSRRCPVCGVERTIRKVYFRCVQCGQVGVGKKCGRQFCEACTRERRLAKARAINRQSRAIAGARFEAVPGDKMEEIAGLMGVSRQRVQQMEGKASRIFRDRYKYAEKKGRPVWEGFVYLDGAMVLGPRSVVGADLEDAAAELLLDLWEHCRASGLSRPPVERIRLTVLPVSEV